METDLEPSEVDLVESDIEQVQRDFWPKIARVAGKIPFVPELVSMYYALLDLSTPFWVKGVIATTLLYFIAPFDAVPDFLAAAGYADDATLVFMTLRLLHDFVLPEHIARARETLQIPPDLDGSRAAETGDDGPGEHADEDTPDPSLG